HIGSQITEPKPFVAAIRKALTFIDRVNAHKNKSAQINKPEGSGAASSGRIQWLNIGGGLGIVYRNERPQTAQEFAEAILPLLKGRKLKLILEPGRFIVGNSGILATEVLYIKRTPVKSFAIVDAGMNDLIRPNLYGAYHEILPVAPRPGQMRLTKSLAAARGSRTNARWLYDVVGPVCESGDCFAKARRLSPLAPGDVLAIMSAGAYGFAMASNYNARPRPAEVLVMGKKAHLVRQRETLKDLVRGEKIPAEIR
ncbi:MAG: diaminopimelate decarboxylase, partial [Candidatus Omnitrophica bacterium]|nr:diaminopimelate decarboxylase [Candidatus Omnitrophota bacterium]